MIRSKTEFQRMSARSTFLRLPQDQRDTVMDMVRAGRTRGMLAAIEAWETHANASQWSLMEAMAIKEIGRTLVSDPDFEV